MSPFEIALAGVAMLIAIWSVLVLAICMLSLIISAVGTLTYMSTSRRFREALEAFEEAFACNLLGKDPHIDVLDYRIHSKVCMLPCKDLPIEKKDE
jgi:hypothetical protein